MIFIDPKLWAVGSDIPIGYVAVGGIIQLRENLVPVDYIVVHQGLPGSMYDASCDGTWLLRKDIIEKRAWDAGNVNAYASSDINTWLNSTMFGMYDANVQSAIKQVKIPYCLGNGNDTVMSGSNGLSCRVFLIAAYEVGFTVSDRDYMPKDGALLDYFTTGSTSAANTKRKANYQGATNAWTLRTPYTQFSTYSFSVSAVGADGIYYCYLDAGIRPCIILPQDFVL